MVFIDPRSRTPYLYAGGSAGRRLRVFGLAPDMVSIKQEMPVEQPPAFTEVPFMHERAAIYYLSYSHGRWNNATYSIHYATAPSALGPWHIGASFLPVAGCAKGQGIIVSSEILDRHDLLLITGGKERTKKRPSQRGDRLPSIALVIMRMAPLSRLR